MTSLRRWFERLGGWYALLGLASLAACWWIAGWGSVEASVRHDLWLIVSLIPVYVGALLVGGLAQVLLPKDLVARWLGAESGFRGLLVGGLAGLLTPGGPFISFPLVLALFNAGADVGALVTFISSWALLGIHRIIIWDIPLMGPDLAALRYLVSLPLPIIAGVLARWLLPVLSPELRRS
jgi:uncharacterized membrane protein YraQ (UPF0718 family)